MLSSYSFLVTESTIIPIFVLTPVETPAPTKLIKHTANHLLAQAKLYLSFLASPSRTVIPTASKCSNNA